jgi:hypothetical protein
MLSTDSDGNHIEMKDMSVPLPRIRKLSSNNVCCISNISESANTYEIMMKEMDITDFFSRFIGLSLILDENKKIDNDAQYMKLIRTSLPWEDKYYNLKSELKSYTKKNIPDWLLCNKISN